eukprot:TRINITY_DN7812_c0_g1_i9.p2 TRINITY_DN7812_c0_g1~~TRINITY_DN7812_c0_g1_i9.p2  ORF type:complete len:162 (-),score=24.01 TRINITY_DN7812_c0_g1_i9:550-1035(-)
MCIRDSVKRVNKNHKMIETVINDNFQGLHDYFTAPNIRRKVRHPVFLTIRFASCVKFFYNTNVFPSSTVITIIKLKLKEVLTVLQMALESEEQEMKDYQQFRQLAFLQITISNPSEEELAKKIIDGISLPEAAPLKVQLSTEAIPKGYVMVTRMASFVREL